MPTQSSIFVNQAASHMELRFLKLNYQFCAKFVKSGILNHHTAKLLSQDWQVLIVSCAIANFFHALQSQTEGTSVSKGIDFHPT